MLKLLYKITEPMGGPFGGLYTILLLVIGYFLLPVLIPVLLICLVVFAIKGMTKVSEPKKETVDEYCARVQKRIINECIKTQEEHNNMYKKFKRDIKSVDKIYYTLVKSTTSNETLKRYVRFFMVDEDGYTEINKPLRRLLVNSRYLLPEYTGKSKKLQGTVILEELEQFNVEKAIRKALGKPYNFVFTDSLYEFNNKYNEVWDKGWTTER